MPRFVILEHDHPHLHWDFMLEKEGKLCTWRLAMPPLGEMVELQAEAILDHRLEYLEYEGPVGGNRGKVARWDRGGYEMQGSEEWGRWDIVIQGERLRGHVILEKIDGTAWLFCYRSRGGKGGGVGMAGESTLGKGGGVGMAGESTLGKGGGGTCPDGGVFG